MTDRKRLTTLETKLLLELSLERERVAELEEALDAIRELYAGYPLTVDGLKELLDGADGG
jgi:hypothetical protein